MIQALVANNTFYLNIKDLQTIVQEVCFVEGEPEVGVMLDFYHDLGMIVKHGNTVVLQAQWLIDLFKQLITIPRYKDVVRNNIGVARGSWGARDLPPLCLTKRHFG